MTFDRRHVDSVWLRLADDYSLHAHVVCRAAEPPAVSNAAGVDNTWGCLLYHTELPAEVGASIKLLRVEQPGGTTGRLVPQQVLTLPRLELHRLLRVANAVFGRRHNSPAAGRAACRPAHRAIAQVIEAVGIVVVADGDVGIACVVINIVDVGGCGDQLCLGVDCRASVHIDLRRGDRVRGGLEGGLQAFAARI